jgi:cytochrome oxidase Cu insertion factor (SCO1/SenC/PrrC family)
MLLRKLMVLSVCFALLVAATPNAAAYKGHQLSRNDIVDFTLIDQSGENFTFSTLDTDVTVVAFIFTSCPDVCPVITQSLRLVQEGLSESDADRVSFVSISVDPERDTPEALTEFTERHGVSWPHLTGDKEILADVYRSFGVLVEQEVIDAHIGVNQDPTVTLVDPSGNATELMFQPTGWELHQAMAHGANWSINATDSQYGHYVTSIEGIEAPADASWWWSLMVHNETSMQWEESSVGIDSIDALEHDQIAWAASNANISLLAPPHEEAASMQVLFPDNTTANHSIETENAWHLSMGAFAGAGMNASMPDGQYGHYMESIDDNTAPSDYSWWWSLYSWNTSDASWESSQVGMDSLTEPTYIAWAPNSTNVSDIPAPGATLRDQVEVGVCNDHGWEMGSGESKHCMCDEGYEWAEDDRRSCVASDTTVIDYAVGHSTITYILDGMTPKVAWTGDSWRSDDFLVDVEAALGAQNGPEDSEGLPGLTFGVALSALGLAAAAIAPRREIDE